MLHEYKLLNLQYDDLLQFLLNVTFKTGFFKDVSYENYVKYLSEIKIKSELINNLENEYALEKNRKF